MEQTESGCAVADLIRRETGFRFIGNYFPSYGLLRNASSVLGQFLSAHMPTRCYLERFNLTPSSIVCHTTFEKKRSRTTQMVRDHQLLQCNDNHMTKIKSRCTTQSGALNWSVALGDIGSLADFAI